MIRLFHPSAFRSHHRPPYCQEKPRIFLLALEKTLHGAGCGVAQSLNGSTAESSAVMDRKEVAPRKGNRYIMERSGGSERSCFREAVDQRTWAH